MNKGTLAGLSGGPVAAIGEALPSPWALAAGLGAVARPGVGGVGGAAYGAPGPAYSWLTRVWSGRWAVVTPDGVKVVDFADPFADEMEFIPTRLNVPTG